MIRRTAVREAEDPLTIIGTHSRIRQKLEYISCRVSIVSSYDMISNYDSIMTPRYVESQHNGEAPIMSRNSSLLMLKMTDRETPTFVSFHKQKIAKKNILSKANN